MTILSDGSRKASNRLPLPPLLALAMAGFITILTEALPAGVLTLMSADLGVSEALIGQSISIYAVGSLLAAIPLTAATQSWRRRPLLILAITGFAIANTITALTDSFPILLAARFLAGVAAGLVWSLLAGYAARMVGTELQGRAIAVAMVGTPLALALGVPLGTALGGILGWRITFGIMSLLALVLIFWVLAEVPDYPGSERQIRVPLRHVLTTRGMRAVLFMTLTFVLGHNILYTYIAPFLREGGLGGRVDAVLLAFGIASLIGIWVIGALVDQRLSALIRFSIAAFAVASLGLGIWSDAPLMIVVFIVIWGLSFGGSATLFQTASARVAGENADLAQSMIVTVWNIAVAGGGMIGGLLLDRWGVDLLPWALIPILLAGLGVSIMKGGSFRPSQ
ncbi:MFS transporter [Pseudomonas sp. GX19020]|uniref:MFS transporter n=1 Tax=Pseudomonas sp. GX19020 TaxID=2942277 RepID=UPI0020188A80|nr:MFS transporter [Pseudomonas sp. GX19020]MCL4065386.1 MFS transporter [Pseudomonas sp. GX19020]